MNVALLRKKKCLSNNKKTKCVKGTRDINLWLNFEKKQHKNELKRVFKFNEKFNFKSMKQLIFISTLIAIQTTILLLGGFIYYKIENEYVKCHTNSNINLNSSNGTSKSNK